MTQLARKVVIIGAGNVGSHVAMNLMVGQYADEIVFLDINDATANAQVEDLKDMLTATRRHVHIRVGTYDDCADASFIVMTAGRSRRPGETRLQMLSSTFSILGSIVEPIAKSGFSGFLICVSNPADVVAEYFYRKLDLPRARVFSTGTSLDTVRLRRHIASIVDVDRDQVEAFCMGEHGDSSFIPTSHVTVGSITLREYLAMNHHSNSNIDFDDVKRMVKESGSKIVGGKGCTEFGIASVVSEIITAILHNEKRLLPLSVHLEGEYGESGISAGTPCIVGANGIDSVLEIDLSYDERRAMRNSCSIIRGYVDQVMPEVPAQE